MDKSHVECFIWDAVDHLLISELILEWFVWDASRSVGMVSCVEVNAFLVVIHILDTPVAQVLLFLVCLEINGLHRSSS